MSFMKFIQQVEVSVNRIIHINNILENILAKIA